MDAYDLEVERLTKEPDLILSAWSHGARHSCLFDDAEPKRNGGGTDRACLTMIRGDAEFNIFQAATKKLTDEIRADERIPKSEEDVCPEHLPVFAEWQRRIDKELGRTPPPMPVEATK